MLMVVAPASIAASTTLHEEIRLRARRVFRRKLDVVDKVRARFTPSTARRMISLLRFAELELAMKFRRAKENVDAAAFAGGFDGVAGGIDVLRHAARQAADDRAR